MNKFTTVSAVVLIFLLCVQNSDSQVGSPLQLGVNLDDNGAFVNLINHTNRYSKATGFDSFGWPKSDFDFVLSDGRPVAEWSNTIDDPEQYRIDYSGTYKSSFNGLATIRASGTSVNITNKFYDTLSNTTYFDIIVGGYPNANHGLVFLNFTTTQRTPQDTINSGITNFKVIRPSYELGTKIFTDEFIALCKSADFACYRYYNLQNIWNGEPTYPAKTTWDNRKTPLDASQQSLASTNGKRDGWCWEYIIELSNILKKDIWICVHISCDSEYVVNLAKLLKEKLDPSIRIYVENSNEVWSPTQATHGPYNQAQATAYNITFDENYALRTVELSNWFASVFGKDEINTKIRVILSGQASYNGRSDNHLNYIKKTFGEPKDYIYATSTALYFGSTKSASTDTLMINQGMNEDINDQITNSKASAYRLNHINKAKNWGLKGGCTSYEGGPGVPSGGGSSNLGNQILAHRTEQMGEVIKFNYKQGWSELDGGLALYFTLTSGYNRYGCWGITDDYTKPDRNFKMKAIRELTTKPSVVEEVHNNSDISITYNSDANSISVHASQAIRNVTVYNVLGEAVHKSTSAIISTSNYLYGVYFLVVTVNNGKQYMRSLTCGNSITGSN